MKRILFTLMAIALVWCAQTSKAEIWVNTMVPASAIQEIMEIWCDGELVDVVRLEGTFHVVVAWTTDENGGRHGHQTVNVNDVTGYSLFTDDTYLAVGFTMWFNTQVDAGGNRTIVRVDKSTLISQGTGINYHMDLVTRFYRDPDRNDTVQFEIERVTCR